MFDRTAENLELFVTRKDESWYDKHEEMKGHSKSTEWIE